MVFVDVGHRVADKDLFDHPSGREKEVADQDVHQMITIGIAAIVPNNAQADSLMDDISLFVEENTEAEILDEKREIR